MYRAKVVVRLKPGVLDPQGQAVKGALVGLGYREVADVRVGKFLEVTLPGPAGDGAGAPASGSPEAARALVEEMCRRLLANPVLEDYEVTVEEADA